jgi:hypothetical protein
MDFRMRRIRAAGIAAAAVACTAVLVPAVAQASNSAPQTAQCSDGNTYVWLALAQNGAAGTLYYPVEFTNLGSRACYLIGYPGVSAVAGATLRDVGPAAGRFGAKPRRVTIGHDQTAHALLGIVQTGFIDGCRTAGAAGIAVYAPNQTERQVVTNFSFSLCRNKVYMHVYPVTPGIGVP